MDPFYVLTFLMLGLMAILPSALAVGAALTAGRRRLAARAARRPDLSYGEFGFVSEGRG